ncbi:hypothetical protein GRJ2_003500400 [Grus japonensis]|uniref:ribonuclease H n=1 Tax=Grus japonensis TaxID=30415 RepID=A0ABC9YKV2_GRUJA
MFLSTENPTEKLEHDCLPTIEQVYSSRPDLKDEPLKDPDLELFTDGSSFMQEGRRMARYAVVTTDEISESGTLPANTSAQKAELVALKQALRMAEGKRVNIRTDSKYAFGVIHTHGERGLLSAQGGSSSTPTRCTETEGSGCNALQGSSVWSDGNRLVDKAAKEAAEQGILALVPVKQMKIPNLKARYSKLDEQSAEHLKASQNTEGWWVTPENQLTLLEAEVSLTGNEWEKHPIVTGPEAPCILGIDYLRRGYFKDPKGYRWAFGIAALEVEEIEPLSSLPGLSEDPSVVGLLRVEEQQVPIATTTVHRWQYRTNRDSLVPIHKLIGQLEGQGVISRTHSPFNSPIWPVRKSNGEWRLTVDYRGLNEVTLPMSAAMPDMLELHYELESKAAKWHTTTDIGNAFFSIPLAAECRPQFAFTWRGVQYTWN